MDVVTTMVVLLLLLAAFMFLVVAWTKGWLKGVRRGSFTGRVVMHDWLNKRKQEAMEYVMDEQEEKEKKDACSGEGDKPGGENEGREPTLWLCCRMPAAATLQSEGLWRDTVLPTPDQ